VRIAMIGTRGVPARYGGFETAVEEIGRRLVDAGHEVVVYCRGERGQATHLGMRRVVLPAVRTSQLETLSHSTLSVAHALAHRPDVAIVFNAANAVLVPALRAARIPVAVHVDGLEWQRAKWGGAGRRWYRWSERFAVRWATELIADSPGITAYYAREHAARTRLLTYGAPILTAPAVHRLPELGLVAGGYHLAVARLEPENHVDVIVEGYTRRDARLPLVVVGSVPYPSEHEARVKELAAAHPKVRMLGAVWDQELLDALYAGSASYLHGHSVGGTNPSLLRAMGAGAPCVAWDVSFNRDVLGATGRYFSDPDGVADAVRRCERDPETARLLGDAGRVRAERVYRWDDVAAGYAAMCEELRAGTPYLTTSQPGGPLDDTISLDDVAPAEQSGQSGRPAEDAEPPTSWSVGRVSGPDNGA
jgi:glycosyltransferase involved in cell wall biosynthesis